jgi:hypothetical protein
MKLGKRKAKTLPVYVTAITFVFVGKCQLRHSSSTGVSKPLPLVYRFVIAAGMGTNQTGRNGRLRVINRHDHREYAVPDGTESPECYHDDFQ